MPGKVLIAIMTAEGREDYRNFLRSRCLRSLPPGYRYVFFTGGVTPGMSGDVVTVNAGDGYLDLSDKVLKFFQYALNHFEFDYIFKADDNSLVFPEQIEGVIADEPDYAGNFVNAPWFSRCWHYGKLRPEEKFELYDVPYTTPYAQGGPGYIIKRRHLECLVASAGAIDTSREFYEDKMVGDWLQKAGVAAKHRKSEFVFWINWNPGSVPVSLKCRSLKQMRRYAGFVTAPAKIRKLIFQAQNLYRRIDRYMMNRGMKENPFLRGEGGFLVCKARKFLAVNIPKNGSRSLLRIIHNADVGGIAPRGFYRYFGYKIDGKHRIHIAAGKDPAYKSYTKFAVYRDPVERIVSLYKDKVAVLRDSKSQSYFLEMGVVGCTFSEFLVYVEQELRKPLPEIDEHIRKQSDFYSFRDVDWIVPLEDLNEFMEQIIGVQIETISEPKNETPTPVPTPEQAAFIKRLYADDFYLMNESNIYRSSAQAVRRKRVD